MRMQQVAEGGRCSMEDEFARRFTADPSPKYIMELCSLVRGNCRCLR
jgi:hypothetical protein